MLILDEPLSGLDPIGRKEFRDILVERRRAGTAVLFSSHVLPDVEMVADRVAILSAGAVATSGSLTDLLDRSAEGMEVTAAGLPAEAAERLAGSATSHERRGDVDRFVVATEAQAVALARDVVESGGRLAEVTPRHATLEDLILRLGPRSEIRSEDRR